MARLWPKKNVKEINIATLEKSLDQVLKPILPNKEFRDELRAQLVGASTYKVLESSAEKMKSGLVIAGGIIGSAAIVIAGVRTVIAVLGALGIIHIKKKLDETPNFKSSPLG
jgi:hypothetical protein